MLKGSSVVHAYHKDPAEQRIINALGPQFTAKCLQQAFHFLELQRLKGDSQQDGPELETTSNKMISLKKGFIIRE